MYGWRGGNSGHGGYGGGAIGGEAGTTILKLRGLPFSVQDEATSAVWGMPGAAAKTGLAERVLPMQAIAAYIAQVAETGR